MAGQQSILNTSFVIAAALANGVTKFTAVILDTTTAHQITYANAVNAPGFIGVAQETANAGDEVDVLVEGIAWVEAAGAVAVGDELILAATNGQVQSVGATVNPNVIGTALTTAANAGDMILMAIGRNPFPSALKKISGVTNAAAGTQNAYAHGLGYVPSVVLVTSKGNGVVYESQAADANNIYFSASAASINFDAFVR